jgi:hypothetical protein
MTPRRSYIWGFCTTAIVAIMLCRGAYYEMMYYSELSRDNIAISSSITSKKETKSRVAIISGFVPSSQYVNASRVKDLDHLVNKACYCKLWGYDYIFNMTRGFDRSIDRHWLEYGAWSRVPHMQAALDHGYDYIMYADNDYVIKDMSQPLESFLTEFRLYDKDVHVFLPRDGDLGFYTFSSFVVMIKNSPFGRAILHHWTEFAKGLCPNGNFPSVKGEYEWTDSDQPGLWYALIKAHLEFYPAPGVADDFPGCSETTGLIDTSRAFGTYLNIYFKRRGAKFGSFGDDLDKVPDDQPIIWSTIGKDSRSGIGLQMNWDRQPKLQPYAFAIHQKKIKRWPKHMHRELELCKVKHGCYAYYNDENELKIGCNNTVYL